MVKYTVPIGKKFTPLELTGYYQSVPGASQRITAATLANTAQVGPVQRQLRQLSLLGFPGFDFVIVGEDEPRKEKLLKKLKELDKRVNTLDMVKHCFYDMTVFGSAFFEKTYKQENGWIVPDIVQWLPARSFSDKPDTLYDENRYMFGRLLHGVVYDRVSSETQFYQKTTDQGNFIQIPSDQMMFCKDPNTEYPDGESYLAGVVPTVQQWQFMRKNFIQFMGRVGKPNAVAKILPEYNNMTLQLPSQVGLAAGSSIAANKAFTGVWNYLDNLVQAQGSENAFVLPPYTDLVYPTINSAINPIEPDQYLIREIISHLFPRDYLESIGKSIQSSGQPLLLLLEMMVAGHREIPGREFEAYWNNILELNGYEETVQIVWWNLLPKDESVEQARIVTAVQSNIMLIDEARQKLGLPKLTDQERKLLYEEVNIKNNREKQGQENKGNTNGVTAVQMQNASLWGGDVTTSDDIDSVIMSELVSKSGIVAKVMKQYGLTS